MSSAKIVLGMGTGRCGTHTLANILSGQTDAKVTHEETPLLPWRSARPVAAIRERLQRFQQSAHALAGDVASFYLPYAEAAIAYVPDIRIICLERPREEVVKSFCKWLDMSHPLPTNHWAAHPAAGWYHELKWTRIFPQYEIQDREEGIRRYWDEYHQEAQRLASRFPDNVRVFAVEEMNSEQGLRGILSFAGIPAEQQVVTPGVRMAANEKSSLHARRKKLADAGPDDPARCVVLVPFHHQMEQRCEHGLRRLEEKGYKVWRRGGYAAVDQARNVLASEALMHGFEELMWIDSDIAFDPESVDLLRTHKLPVTCGIYPKKGKRSFAFNFLKQTKRINFGKDGGLLEIRHAGAGFLHTRREVYETMQFKLHLPVCNEKFEAPVVPFFQPMHVPHEDGYLYLAEDYAFCHRLNQCGYPIVADTTIRLHHIGAYPYGWEDAGSDKERYGNYIYTIIDSQ